MSKDEKNDAARAERAKRLREQIDELKKGSRGLKRPPPSNERDFVHDRMRDVERSDDK
jgi:hypothetical protein